MNVTRSIAVTVVITGLIALSAVALLYAALHDVAFRTIPNWIPALLLVAGVILQVTSGTLLPGLAAGLVVLLAAGFCWHRGWLGGGDVKLLAAAVVLVPPALTVELLLDVALAGGVLALFYLTLARIITSPLATTRPPRRLQRICRAERYRICRRGSLPYASAIAAGAFLVLMKG